MADVTLNPGKWGYIVGPQSTTFSTARDASVGASVQANPTTALTSVGYQYYGRGTLQHQCTRAFFSFNTSAYTTATAAKLVIKGANLSSAAPLILVASTAFGSGASDLTTDDFDALNHTKTHSSTISTWDTSGFNQINLNSTALNVINSSAVTYYRVALLQYTNDNQNTAASTSTLQSAGINWSTDVELVLTVPSADGPTRLSRFNKYEKSRISKLDGYALSKIASINGVD